MNNLFSIFDPVTHFGTLSINWLRIIAVLLIPSLFWVRARKSVIAITKLINFLYQELKSVLYSGYSSSHFLALISFLIYIFINNFLGLLPYVFTATSHLSITLRLALPFWVGYIILNLIKNTGSVLAHLVPKGTPPLLIPFMVIIELIRNLIRPITLAVRLAANIVAGHLLLVLTRGQIPSISWPVIRVAFIGLILLIILELGVSFIQAYVFTTLSSLYLDEVNNPNN